MKADSRISIKDYRRNKNLKVLLYRPSFPSRGFMVRMNGERWPKDGGPVCVTDFSIEGGAGARMGDGGLVDWWM
jgi:hypothetical protein